MQEQPPPQQPAPPDIHIDLGPIVDGVVNGLRQVLTDLVNQIPNMMLKAINSGLSDLWNGLWDSGANLLATPFALTVDFPPARFLGANLFILIYSIALLSVILLGLRSIWASMTGTQHFASDALNGVLMGIMLATSGAFIIATAFMLTGFASDAIGRLSYRPVMDPQSLLTVGPNFILAALTFVIMFIYGWKMFVRAAYRLTLLMFATPFAPVASALWGIPQLRWVASFYWKLMGGWLVGGFLAIGAVSLGVQIAFGGSNAVLGLIFGVALMQLAHDLMAILTPGGGGMSVGSPFGSMLNAAGGAAAVAAVGGAAAAGMAATSASSMASVAGALPSGDSGGYGY